MKNIILTISLIIVFTGVFAKNNSSEKNSKSKTEDSAGTLLLPDFNKNYIYPEWGYYIDATPGLSLIQNKNLPADVMSLQNNMGYSFNAGYFKTILPFLKLKTGIGITGLKNTLEGNGNAPAKQFSDVDNDNYLEQLTLYDVKNDISSTFLSVPLVLEFGNTNINRPGFYVNVGVMYSFLVNDSYQSSGTYSATGEYKQWGVTLANVDELGFYKAKNLDANARFRKNNFSLQGGLGITVPMSSAVIFKAGFSGNFGLTDLGNNPLEITKNNPLTPEVYKHRSPYIDNSLAVTKGTKTRQLGFEIGLLINKQLK